MDQYWNVPGYKEILNYIQVMQVLDLVFSILKFTRNQVITTFLQVFSRIAMVLAIFPNIEKPHGPQDWQCVGIFLCLINWSMIEVIRFGFYSTKEMLGDGLITNFFGHLRYNVFIFAYILGVTGENIACYYVLQEINRLNDSGLPLPWTIRMPNKWNFVFDFRSFMYISPLMYLGGFPGLYLHMWAQRAKFYGGTAKKTDEKKTN